MASPRSPDLRRLDVAAFAAAGASLDGAWPLATLARLASAQVPGNDAGVVDWRVAGLRAGLDGAGVRPALDLSAAATVHLQCQRCLQPMALGLDVRRRVFFVDSEEAAEALDLDSDDDVLALAPLVDVQALIEDELLLALPIVPRHDVCPEPLDVPPDDAAAPAEHPFAVLAALRTERRGH